MIINRFKNNKKFKNIICLYYSSQSNNNNNNNSESFSFDQFFRKPKPKIDFNDNIYNDSISTITINNNINNSINKNNNNINNNNKEIIIKEKYNNLFNEIQINNNKNKKLNNYELNTIKLILSEITNSKSLLSFVLKSESITVSKTYQLLFNSIMDIQQFEITERKQFINDIIKDLLHLISDNQSIDANIHTYDESEDYENGDNYKISRIFSELVFYNEVYQKSNNEIIFKEDDEQQIEDYSNKVISYCLKHELNKTPFQEIKKQTIINLIMLFLEDNRYHLALKWLSIGIQYSISHKFLYKCFYLYHINKSNTNRIKKDEQLLLYWIELYGSSGNNNNNNNNSNNNNNDNNNNNSNSDNNNNNNNEDINEIYLKENNRYLLNLNDNNNNNNNNNNNYINSIYNLINNNNKIYKNKYFDEKLELLITNGDITQLVDYLDNNYFNNNNNNNNIYNNDNNLIPNGKQLILASELIKFNSKVYHTHWYYTNVPKFIKPMIHHFSTNQLIIQDFENGLRIYINKEKMQQEEYLKSIQHNNEILTYILFGLINIQQFQFANDILDQLVYNLYCKPILELNININNNSNSDISMTTTTNTTLNYSQISRKLIKHLQSSNNEISKIFKEILSNDNSPTANKLKKLFYENCQLNGLNKEYVLQVYEFFNNSSGKPNLSIPSSLKYNLPIEIVNLSIMSFIKEGEIEKAYRLFELVPRKDQMCLNIGLKIYSHMYPIPPIENFLKWESIRYHYRLNSVNTELLKDSILQCLYETNNQDLLIKLYQKGAFNIKSLSQDSLLILLKTFEKFGHFDLIKSTFNQYRSLKRYNQSLLQFLYQINTTKLNNDQINHFIQKYKETMINDVIDTNYNNQHQQLSVDILSLLNLIIDKDKIIKKLNKIK